MQVGMTVALRPSLRGDCQGMKVRLPTQRAVRNSWASASHKVRDEPELGGLYSPADDLPVYRQDH